MLPGPFCSMILADLGAEVIKVESHKVGDLMRRAPPRVGEESCYFMSVNRNKKSLALNLKRREGREIFLQLAQTSDVIIEGFQPGQAKRLGIAYDDIQSCRPDIIYCSISGYGQEGPYADRAGHNINYVALAGMLDLSGAPGAAPAISGVQTADIGGALFAAIGVLSALVARSLNGTGAYIDASLFHSAVSMMTFSAATLMIEEAPVEPRQRHLAGLYPCYNVYQTKDGRYMALGALETVWWGDFCEAIGRNDLIAVQFPREGERESVIAEVQRVFAERTQQEWTDFFADRNLCCEPINTLQEALFLPVVRDRGMVRGVDHPSAGRLHQIGSPLRSSSESWEQINPPPLLGQHTVEILQSLGYDDEAIQQLIAKQVVATAQGVAGSGKKP
jgi:alpha-methylacyl-CoA racemase